MTFFVYVLESEADGKLYIGLTKDLDTRLKYHNGGRVRSTKHRRPLRLAGRKPYTTFTEARTEELRLKAFKDPSRIRAWLAQ